MADDLNLKSVLSLDVSPFELGLVEALRAAKDFASAIASALNVGIQDSIERVAGQFRKSGNFDITTLQLQQMQFAASQTGTALGTLEMAFRTLEKTAGKATFGDKGANATFAKIGLDPKAFATMDLRQQMDAVAGSFAKITNTAQRAAVSAQLFGRSGIEVSQFLKELNQQSDTFEKLAVGSSEFSSALEFGAKQSLGEISIILDDIYNQIATKVSPIITNVVHQMEEWGFTGKALKRYIDSAFVSLVNFSAEAISFGLSFMDMWPKIWTGIKNVFDQIASGLGSLTKDFGTFILAIEPSITALTGAFSNISELSELGRLRSERDSEFAQAKRMSDRAEKASKEGRDPSIYNRVGQGAFERGTSAQTAIDKLLSERAERQGGESVLEKAGKALQGGTFFSDLGKEITDPFKGIIAEFAEKMKINNEKAWEILGPLVYGSANDAAKDRVEGRGKTGALSIPEDEKKIHSSPLGYAINATNTRASLNALRLAHTEMQKVEDTKTHELLGYAVQALKAHAPNVTTLQE